MILDDGPLFDLWRAGKADIGHRLLAHYYRCYSLREKSFDVVALRKAADQSGHYAIPGISALPAPHLILE